MAKPVYLFTNRVYPPAPGATGELLRQLAEALAEDGSRVVVVTGAHEGCPHRSLLNGVDVIRVWSPPLRRSSHWQRAMGYAALYPQFAWHMLLARDVDAVVSMTDPPMQMLIVPLAGFRAWRKIHWAQDVYPEVAGELGVIPAKGLLSRTLRWLANSAMRRHHDVVVPGRCMREVLIGLGVSARRLEVIPNWSSLKAPAAGQVETMRRKLGWEGKFVVLYSGNLGLAHDFDTVAEAVRLLQGESVVFAFAGEGPRRDELRNLLVGAENVRFLPPQPAEELAAFLGAADLHLVTVRPGLGGLVVPSKTYGIMACGRPLVYVGRQKDEIGRLIGETGAGMVVRNGNAGVLAEAIRGLAKDDRKMRLMGEAALKASENFTQNQTIGKWRGLLI